MNGSFVHLRWAKEPFIDSGHHTREPRGLAIHFHGEIGSFKTKHRAFSILTLLVGAVCVVTEQSWRHGCV
jgi:hypothetical protein